MPIGRLSLEEILALLDGVRKAGHDKWVARCPVHHDDRPSLSVARGSRVAVLLRCFACGARFPELMEAIDARAAGVRR